MNAKRCLAATLLAMVTLTCAAHAQSFQPPSVLDAIRGTGFAIPAAWSGVWQYEDSTYQCTPRLLTGTESGLDTLCAGATFEPDTVKGVNYDCTGTVTDTFVDITCSGAFDFDGCVVTFTSRVVATRTGNALVATTTISTVYTPPGCAFQPDDCMEIVTRSTRIGPQPGGCATPAIQGTWGALKTRYR